VIRALEHAAEPDLLVDLHWTLAQCRMLAGESVESLATLDGIRRKPHAKHRGARSGWDSLTATEIKIAAFVEEGLSNPEIAARLLLSQRTVATHVSQHPEEARRSLADRHSPRVSAAHHRAEVIAVRGARRRLVGTVRRRGYMTHHPRV